MQDIEDSGSSICTNIRSPYFSPLQTSQQRKIKHLSLVKVSDATATKPYETIQKQEKTDAKKIKQIEKPLSEKIINCDAKETSPTLCDDVRTLWEPENWQNILENIRIMRLSNPAPVDTMGCHKCADQYADETV